jgi:hypothetical protein
VDALPKARGSVACRGRVESPAVESLKEENEGMPVVRVLLREGQEKRYHEANAAMHTPDRT